MLNQVPKNLNEEVERTLASLEDREPVEPPCDLTGKIMARIHEAMQPGYYPILDSNQGEDHDLEGWEMAKPRLVYPSSKIDEQLQAISAN